jgi:hypothetical protein
LANTRESVIIEPHAGSLIESLRAFGYDLKTAIADLIDNSITAGAKNVWIEFLWNGHDSCISVTDDGRGMSASELLEAMRVGSQSPIEDREPTDLGRFGLGMKTASFSQCRRLTVRSKTKDNQTIESLCWNLDFVSECGEWRALKNKSNANADRSKRLPELKSGTVILWEAMDRIVGNEDVDNETAKDNFFARIDEVRGHLAMVFHRFMSGPHPLVIWINDRVIEPWDPYLENEEATQKLPVERFKLRGQEICVSPYILPHHSKIDQETHEKAAGPQGWNAHQGFYIYRNRRLLVPGDWLGLGFQKEEHFKLARILLDIPNSVDDLWAIDVRKARAHPPTELHKDLRRIARLTRQKASDIYRHRGKVVARSTAAAYVFAWEKKVKHGKIFYSINRKHPLVKESLTCSPEQKGRIRALLVLLEETIPVPSIIIDNAERPDSQPQPFERPPSSQLFAVLGELYKALINQGVSHKEAQKRLSTIDPFDRYPEQVAAFLEKLKQAPYEGEKDG